MSSSSIVALKTHQSPTPTNSGGSIAIGKLFSIELRLHISVVIIGSLIVASLARGLLPEWHPQWSAAEIWSAALLAGLLFFASLVAHELAHALTARRYGIETEHITLFLFGALAAIEREPGTPRQDMLIAGAGPAMSLGLAALFGVFAILCDLGLLINAGGVNNGTDLTPQFADLSLLGTVFLWLTGVNAMLGLFNLIPGFPMDGGRILRALIWLKTGSLVQATQSAARGGVIFGWILMLYGGLLLLQGLPANGLWLVAIGYFISHLANASKEQSLRDQALRKTTVADLMRTRFERVSGALPLDEFAKEYLLRSSQQVWPVTIDGSDVGFISIEDLPTTTIQQLHDYRWVADCMHSIEPNVVLSPDMKGIDALRCLVDQKMPMPVVEGRETPNIVGLIHHTDVLRWISQHNNLLADGKQGH